MNSTMMHRVVGPCIAVALLFLIIAACGEAETEPAVSQAQPAAAVATQQPAVAPTAPAAAVAVATPTAVTEAAPMSESGPTKFTVAAPFAPSNNGAIETDDSFLLSRAGVTETLIKIDFDGQVKPYLAESWSLRDDNAWEFELREDVSFHDGAPFNGESVVEALSYLHGVPNPPRGFTSDTLESVEAVESHTVVIRSGTLDVLLPTRLAGPTTAILADEAYESRGDGPPSPVSAGTGPFVVEDKISIESLAVARNEDYWDGVATIDAGEVLYVSDGLVRSAMLETGEADFVRHLPVSQLPLFEDSADFVIHRDQQPRTVTLYINNRKGPFSDVNIRKAAQHAVDRQAIVDSVLEGVGEPAVGPFAPAEAWVNSGLAPYEFDPQASKDLLAEAGYGEGDLKVSIWTYPSRAEFPAMSVAIHEMLNEGGFNAEIRLAPYGALVDDVFAGNFDMFLVSRGHLIDAYDPEGFFTADYSCESMDVSNYSNYCNAEVDALLEQARPLSDSQARYEIYREIQDILHEEAATVFLNYTDQVFAYGNHVRNWQPHLLEYYILTPQLDIAQ